MARRENEQGKFEKFSICAPIGLLGQSDDDPNSIDNELGIGINFYFKLTSYLGIIFAIFTVISLPVYILYAKGRSNDITDGGNRNFLSNLTLGNIGEAGTSCLVLPSVNEIMSPKFKYDQTDLVCKYG